MKKGLLRVGFLIFLGVLLGSCCSFAQETSYTSGNSFYYNPFDNGLPGLAITYQSASNQTIKIQTSPTPLKGAYSLVSVPNLNNINRLYTTFVPSGTDLKTQTNTKDDTYTWSFIYRNNSSIDPVEPFAPGQTGAPYKNSGPSSGSAAWRFWLTTNSTDFTQTTTQGYYVSHIGNKIVLRYRDNDYYQVETSYQISDNIPYIIRITKVNSLFTLYVDQYVSSTTEATTSRGTINSGTISTFNSYFDCTDIRAAGNTFQWDDLKFYKNNRVTVTGYNALGSSPGNGITTPTSLYEGQTGVVLFGFSINARGFSQINRIYINNTTGTNNFSSTGKLYSSTSSTFSLTGPNPATQITTASVSIYGTNIQLNSLALNFATSDVNASSTSATPTTYYFIVGDVNATATLTDQARFAFPWTGTEGSIYSNNDGILDNTSTATGQTFTFYRQYVWSGGADKYWPTYGNWKNSAGTTVNTPPNDGTAIVIIPSSVANFPTSQQSYYDNNAVTTLNLKSLTVAANSKLSITKADNLQIGSGGLTIDGTLDFSYSNDSTYPYPNYEGNNTVSIASGATATVNNLTINKLTKASTVTINSTGDNLNVTGILSINAGSLATGGKLILKSTSASTASVDILNSNNAAITGNVTVERYVTGGSTTNRGYRLMSAPVNSSGASSLQYLTSTAYVSGTSGTNGGFNGTGNPTIYLFRDGLTPSNTSYTSGNFRGVNKINNTTLTSLGVDNETGTYSLYTGNGFLFFFRGGPGTVSPTSTLSTPLSGTFSQTGTLNQGKITFKHWFTGASNLSYASATGNTNIIGYNLIGNPYPCTINFEKYNRTGSSSIVGPASGTTIWVFNPTNKQYEAYTRKTTMADTTSTIYTGTGSATNMIASGQGFFIRASATGQTLVFNETAKTTTQPSSTTLPKLMGLPKEFVSQDEQIRLQLVKDSVNTDEILYTFSQDSKDTYDSEEDAEDLGGSGAAVSLSSIADNMQIAINKLPLPAKKSKVLPLLVDATTSGQYKLNVTQVLNIPPLYEVWLKDNFKKDSLDLRANSTYTFDLDKGNTATFGSNRFQIVIRQNPALALHFLSLTGVKEAGGIQLKWKTENEFNYVTFNVERSTDNGQTFSAIGNIQSNGSGNYTYLDNNLSNGVYVYRIKQNDVNDAITYSDIVSIKFSDVIDAALISVYPNPTASSLNIAITSSATTNHSYDIQVVSSSGSLVKKLSSSQPKWSGSMADLLPGVYFVTITDGANKNVIGKAKFTKL